MVTRTLYEVEKTGVTGDFDVAVNSEIDLIDDDETDSGLFIVNPLYDVGIGDEFNFYDYKQENIFSGIVKQIVNQIPKRVTVFKYDIILDERIVNDIYEGYTIEGLIEHIVTLFTDFTFETTFVSGIIVDRYVSKNKKAKQVIRDLLGLVPELTFVVTNDKVFKLFIKGSFDSGLTLENGVNSVLVGGWKQDTSKQVTRLLLSGEKQVQQDKVQFLSGDGTQKEFFINEIPSSIKVELNGVELELDLDGQRIGSYKINPTTKKITFFDSPSAGTDNIKVTYTFEIDIQVEYDADFDIQAKYDIIEKPITKKHLTNMDEAFSYAGQYVEKFGEPLLTGKLRLTQSFDITNLIPGYSITVIDKINTIDNETVEEFLYIKSVNRTFSDGIIVEVGEVGGSAFNLISEIKYNLSQLYEQDNNSSTIFKSQNIKNTLFIDIEDEIELQLYRDLPDDYMYLGDANDTPVYANIGDGTERPFRELTLTNNGTVTGGVTISNNYIAFDGTGTVTIDNIDNLTKYNIKGTDYKLTLAMWFRSTATTSGYKFLWTKGNQFGLSLADASTFDIYSWTDGDWSYVEAPYTPNTDVLLLVEFQHGVDGLKAYINDVLVGSDDMGTIDETVSGVLMGEQFEGLIYSGLAFDKILTTEQKTALFNAGKDSYSVIRDGLYGQYSGKDYIGTEALPTIILDTNYNVEGEIFLITDKSFWNTPDEEIAEHGIYKSWKPIE